MAINFRQLFSQVKSLRDRLAPTDTLPEASQSPRFDANPQDILSRVTPLTRALQRAKQKVVGTNVIEVKNKPKPVTAEISSYTADPAETDDRPRETATQTEVKEGRTIATNNKALLGKKVKIGGITYIIEDLMGPRFRKRFEDTGALMFDIFKEDKKEALKFGRQNLPIEILK